MTRTVLCICVLITRLAFSQGSGIWERRVVGEERLPASRSRPGGIWGDKTRSALILPACEVPAGTDLPTAGAAVDQRTQPHQCCRWLALSMITIDNRSITRN